MNDNHRIAERDERGRIKTMLLSADAAREIVAQRRTKERKAADGVDAVLQEMGYSDNNPAPALISNLAEIAVSQKTGAVSAIGTLLRFAHGGAGETGVLQLQAGDVCPTCNTVYGGMGADLAREIVQRLRAAR